MVQNSMCTAGNVFLFILSLLLPFLIPLRFTIHSFRGWGRRCVRARIYSVLRGSVGANYFVHAMSRAAKFTPDKNRMKITIGFSCNPGAACMPSLSFVRVNHPSRTQNIRRCFFIDFASLYLLDNYCCFSSRSVHFGGFFSYIISCIRSFYQWKFEKSKEQQAERTKKTTSLASRVLCLKFFINRARSAQQSSHKCAVVLTLFKVFQESRSEFDES